MAAIRDPPPSTAKALHEDEANDASTSVAPIYSDPMAHDLSDVDLPPLPSAEDDSFIHNDHKNHILSDGSAIEDQEMKRHLMDIESSFLPEPSAQTETRHAHLGADDTYLFGGSPGNVQPRSEVNEEDVVTSEKVDDPQEESRLEDTSTESASVEDKAKKLRVLEPQQSEPFLNAEEPPTPADAYKTPAAGHFRSSGHTATNATVSTSDSPPSSPSAEAAQRLQSRTGHGSNASNEGQSDVASMVNQVDHPHRPTSSASTVRGPEFTPLDEGFSLTDGSEPSIEIPNLRTTSGTSHYANTARRTHLHQRRSSQRSSVSSFTNHSDVSGDLRSPESVNLGPDFALQTGGAIPRSAAPHRNSVALSRLPSLGSIASSMSVFSESNLWEKNRSISTNSITINTLPDGNLTRLDEEIHMNTTPPETPRARSVQPAAPTDTTIARHIQNIQVPDTIAREFREKHARSPDKRQMTTSFTRSKHNLTLKEQNSKIDKLSKENFDLKLKIHFLDQALQNRSDEGVKDMISKNVQLQTDLATEKKDNLALRKTVKDLERRLKTQEDGLALARDSWSGSDDEKSDISKQAELEEEVEYLRERLETTETIIEQWQQETMQKEADNRRMAGYIKTMREKGPPSETVGVNEAITMWKDDLEHERTHREEVENRCRLAEAESERLREELIRMREQNQQRVSMTNSPLNMAYNVKRRNNSPFAGRSNAGSERNGQAASMSVDGTSGTLIDQLQSDNEKLQRDLHAQASMLTSRNRENLRLREENEGLKLTIRRGDVGSIAGDSILERSISRNHMRSVSRASGGTRVTQVGDPDREDLESKHAALRDELSQFKLSYKELDDQLNGHLDMLETAELKIKDLEKEVEAQNEDLQAIANERNEALDLLQDKEQECQDLRQEALDTVQRLEIELEHKQHERDRILIDLENTTEDFNALQQEMKNVSESLIQLEDDRELNLQKRQNYELELADANLELGKQDKLLSDERAKNERLDIQLESCQGEVDFLREEQESDKIKIGELESALNIAHATIEDDKERFKEVEERVEEEQQQREALDSHEKQEVQKILNDLNVQLSKLKDDNRRLRKGLSGKDVEAVTWKQHFEELEGGLRQVMGDLNGSKASLLKDVTKLQRDLEAGIQALDTTKNDLAEKDQLLRNRDALLESTGLESRRLADILERERQARRQEQAAFDNVKRGHQSATRSVQQHESRVLELETLRSQDRQKIHGLEKQYKEHLLERNNLLYALWNRLSTLCGAEWCRNHALVNGELTSMELISKNIQGFNKNIILAVMTVEGVLGGFKQRIRAIEKDLLRDYQTLEHTVDVRGKRMDHMERLILAQRQSIGRPSTVLGSMVDMNSAEINKLRTENKTLRTEVQTLRTITSVTSNENEGSRSPSRADSRSPSKRASMQQTLLRAQSASIVEHLQQQAPGHPYPASVPLQPSEQKWIHRLKELERRLKAEREARLLDRSGARKRLEQKVEENADLRAMLEKEREKNDDDDTEIVQKTGSAGGNHAIKSGRMGVLSSLRRGYLGKEKDEEIY